jgi:hypothetical protein
MKHCCLILIPAALILRATNALAPAQQPPTAGLDAIDQRRVMTELANHGLETLLNRQFEVDHIPSSEQTPYRTLLAVHTLSDSQATLTPSQRQELIDKISREIQVDLPSIDDPTTLMQIAKILLTTGVEPQVNTLEYWGENPKTQAQVRPLIQIVLDIYDRAAAVAARQADQIANHLAPNDDAGAKRWQALDELRTLATFSQSMAKYDLCLAMDRTDPARQTIATAAIDSLKQFDNNDSAVQAMVRNQIAKLTMAKGDYAAAIDIFSGVINNPNGLIKPPPDIALQYQARYFTIVCQILNHDLQNTHASMDALQNWQKRDLGPAQQQGAAAAFVMLNYRMLSEQADAASDPDIRGKENDQAMGVLMQLLKDQPQYKGVVAQQMLTRLPMNPDLSTLDPLLLLALQQQGEQEDRKPVGATLDTPVLERAIDAAREILKRQGHGLVDSTTAARSAYVIPYLLEKLGRNKEAAGAFLDFAQNFQSDLKNANDALDHATVLIAQLRKQDLQDAETRKLYDRFLPLAIGRPFDRWQFAFEYAVLLQREQKYKQAVQYFTRVPPNDSRILVAHFYEMVALKQRLNDEDDRMTPSERGRVMSQIQSLADEVTARAAASPAGVSDSDKKRNASMLVRTALLAADLADHEQKDPRRCLEVLRGFEEKVRGMANQQDLLFEALSLRVNAYMSLGQTSQATAALVQLLQTKQGNEGPALVFDLLKKLDADMDHARAAGDMAQVNQLAQNRATLSAFLVTWAANNPDPKIKALTSRYKVFDASTRQLAAELTDDPVAKKAGLISALREYFDLSDPANPDPVVQLGIGMVQYDLGNYKAAKEALGPLVANKKLGAATVTVMQNGEPKIVENTQYWEGILRLLQSTAQTAQQNPDDVRAQKDLESARAFLKQLYVQWPQTIGGRKFHSDYEKLRQQIVPDFDPQQMLGNR